MAASLVYAWAVSMSSMMTVKRRFTLVPMGSGVCAAEANAQAPIAGLARVLRGNLSAGLEDVALWHERDISHSSVERVILPDSSLLAYYELVKMRAIVEGMQVHADRMVENLDRSYGLVFSQPVLLALVDAGLARDEAYRIVQEAARTAWEQRRPLREVLDDDARVSVPPGVLDDAFSLGHALRNVGLVFEALEEVEA